MADYPKEIKEIVDEITASLIRGFELGKQLGVTEGEARIRKELEILLNRTPSTVDTKNLTVIVGPEGDNPSQYKPLKPETIPDQRAPKGTVRPAILAELSASGIIGMAPDTLLKRIHGAGHTMIKAETVRTTLHKMVKEGVVTKRGGVFYPVGNKNPDALASGP